MTRKNQWIVICTAVALAVYGSIWHPNALQTIGIGIVFLFVLGFLYFSDRLDSIERKLIAISKAE